MDNTIPMLLVGDTNLPLGDCDCACSSKPFNIGADFPRNKQFKAAPNIYSTKISQFWLVLSPLSPVGPCVLNESGWQRLLEFCQQPSILSQEIDFELANQNLVIPVNSEISLDSLGMDHLVVWLHISNACNLECPYCYVRKSSERMTEELGKQAILKIVDTANENGIKRVKVKYAGGEATLHFDLILKLHKYLHFVAGQNNIEINEIILSNGVFLKPKFIDWLAQSNTQLMISLDGVGDAHDKQRPMKDGQGSFGKIEKNILDVLVPNGIVPHISITVTNHNASNIAELVEWVIDRNLPFSLNFYRENEQSSSFQALRLQEQKLIDGMIKAYQVIESKLPNNSILNNLLDKVVAQAHTHTCGVGQNYLVINHLGHLSQCQMHLNSPVSTNLSQGSLLMSIQNGFIQNISVDEKKGCQDCSFRYRCAGGCPVETFRVTGRWDVQSPHCNIYKTLYPIALRLEGLRLLKNYGFSVSQY